MQSSHRRTWSRALVIVALLSAALWGGSAQAMNVTLAASPTANICHGNSVQLAANATNVPSGTQIVIFHFTVNTPSNAFEMNLPWTANSTVTWMPRVGASVRGPFTLWVVANALSPGGQVIGSAFASISGYRVIDCQLNVGLYPKPPTSVQRHCLVSLSASAFPHAPPAGQHYEYVFYVQDNATFITVPGGCPRSTNHLCQWRPDQLGTFRLGVQVYRMSPPSTVALEVATKEIADYAVVPAGPCP